MTMNQAAVRLVPERKEASVSRVTLPRLAPEGARSKGYGGYAWALAAATLVGSALVYQGAVVSRRGLIETRQNAVPAPALVELARSDAQLLVEYRWVDQKEGVVRVPVARAKELLLRKSAPPSAQNPHSSPSNSLASRAAPP